MLLGWKSMIGFSLLRHDDGTWQWRLVIPDERTEPEWVTSGRASSRDDAIKLANEAQDRLPDQPSY